MKSISVWIKRRSLVVARTGHCPMSDLSPLSGEERKSDFGAARSVDDPFCDIGRAEQSDYSMPVQPYQNSRFGR